MWQCISDHRVYLTKVGEMTAKHLSYTMMYSRYESVLIIWKGQVFLTSRCCHSNCTDWKLWSASY